MVYQEGYSSLMTVREVAEFLNIHINMVRK
jgi:hypothetical protein